MIAIDGPVASGKSTVAKLVAQRLGFRYVDTGAMYRAVAWKVMQAGLRADQADEIASLCRGSRIALTGDTPAAQRVVVDGQDISEKIRMPQVSELASVISTIAAVRERLVGLQRELGRVVDVVVEGRDIQTVVFPDAELKVFLTASPAERAKRRYLELKVKGIEVTEQEVLADLQRRDQRDQERGHSPLKAAPDAIFVDTDGITAEEAAARVVALAIKHDSACFPEYKTG